MLKKRRILALSRRRNRSFDRKLTRWHVRLAPGARRPDYLGAYLYHIAAAIKCWKRLARLAPDFFNTEVIEKRRADDVKEAARLDVAFASICKVYEVDPSQQPTGSEDLRQRRAREEQWTWDRFPRSKKLRIIWLHDKQKLHMELAREYMTSYTRLRRDIPSFFRMANMLDLGFTLGRMAIGAPGTFPPPPKPRF